MFVRSLRPPQLQPGKTKVCGGRRLPIESVTSTVSASLQHVGAKQFEPPVFELQSLTSIV